MTPEQKSKRILDIEKDVHNIMMQLHTMEYRVERNLVERNELPFRTPQVPPFRTPHIFKKIWVGFIEDMKHQKNPN